MTARTGWGKDRLIRAAANESGSRGTASGEVSPDLPDPSEQGSSERGSQNGSLPRWDFSEISKSIPAQREETGQLIGEIPDILRKGEQLAEETGTQSNSSVVSWLETYLQKVDRIAGLLDEQFSYAYCNYTIATSDSAWIREINRLEEQSMPLSGYSTRFRLIFRDILRNLSLTPDSSGLKKFLAQLPAESIIQRLEYFLQRELEGLEHQMSPELEDLASDLQRSAGDAWGRLQSSMSSEMNCRWNDVTGETKTVVELRNLAFSPSRQVREKAYHLELSLWKRHETAFAAALNGVKGNSISLYNRRNYPDMLDPSLRSSRISRKTLDSLIQAMEDALPMFRRYLKRKASCLGQKTLAFYDLFAPVGEQTEEFSYREAEEFIVDRFNSFSPDLGEFARNAFKNRWIDAQPRSGKVGGAYMTDFPLHDEARILANFDGSFSAVSTLAHELGHAYHSAQLEGLDFINRDYPMTLAETASTFCETIVYHSAIEQARGDGKLALVEGLLMENTQVIVDILSRFRFERSLFQARQNGELSPHELNELMLDAQRETYGDAVDDSLRHPYMWAVKGHYYSTDLAFYNYPYAFGQLFALGLYSQFRENPGEFPETYRNLLRNTGTMSAVDLCRMAGFDIETPDFWKSGLSMLEPYVEWFENAAGNQRSS
ncbi:M3 family oligoendopeptidase [Salinispira pacifica]|nr:M3 family oligoendopeptidase [Salinispira pacifica]